MKTNSRLPKLLGDEGLTRQYIVTIAIGILLLIAIGPTNLIGPYPSYIIALSLIYGITTLSVSMLAHTAGIWSIGHTAFMAIGSYLAANLSDKGFSVEMTLLIAMASSWIIGFLVGVSAGRFSTLYMTILTQALCLVSLEVIGRWHSVTGGDQGIPVPPAQLLFLDRPLKSIEVILMVVVLAVLVFLVGQYVFNGPRGKRWLAIKSQRMAAMSIGLKPNIENALAFAFSGALASTAGVCLAYVMRYISPEGFQIEFAIMILLTSIVGGVGSIGGTLMGGIFLATVPEMAREIPGASAYVFGIATIVILLFLPKGIVPEALRWFRRWKQVADKKDGKGLGTSPEHVGRGDLNEVTAMVGEFLTGARETLTVEGLCVSFGGLKALEDVSLQVAPGQIVGLIGPNGAGKTTLLNVLSGYVKPSRVGKLFLGSSDLAKLPAYARTAHGFGRTFQHAELFNELPIRESIIQATRQGAAIRKKAGPVQDPVEVADRLIDALRLRPFAQAYPTEVPFGIQKVADIARTLATGAQIVVMDEPFSGLDAAERDEVRAILHGMRKAGVSILIIDHVVKEVFDIANHVVVLDFGRVLASGSPSQIRKDPKVLEAYLGSALKEEEVQVQ